MHVSSTDDMRRMSARHIAAAPCAGVDTAVSLKTGLECNVPLACGVADRRDAMRRVDIQRTVATAIQRGADGAVRILHGASCRRARAPGATLTILLRLSTRFAAAYLAMVTIVELIIPALDTEHGMETEKGTLTVLEGLAHELRTPLSAIGGYAELLRLGMHGPVTTAQAEVLVRITRNQDIMVGIITDFMAYAQLDAGAVRLVPTLSAMSDIVQGGIEKIGSRAAVQGVQISRSTDMHVEQHPSQARVLDAADVTVLVDVRAAMTVVAELLRDALDTAGADGQVNVDLAVSSDRVDVLIESSGEPIAASRVDAVFVPFDRTRGPGYPPARPPALSLPHARLMARLIGGDVTAVPHESRRALVFTLPISS